MYWRAALCVCVCVCARARVCVSCTGGHERRQSTALSLDYTHHLRSKGCFVLWSVVLGPCAKVYGLWSAAYGARSVFHGMVRGLCSMVWSVVYGLCFEVYGLWPMIYCLWSMVYAGKHRRPSSDSERGRPPGTVTAPWRSWRLGTHSCQARVPGVTAPWRSWIALALMACLGAHGPQIVADLSRGQPPGTGATRKRNRVVRVTRWRKEPGRYPSRPRAHVAGWLSEPPAAGW